MRSYRKILPYEGLNPLIDDFMPAFHAKEKNIVISLVPEKSNPFLRNYAYHYPYPFDMDSMKKATSNYFIGTHDFTSFLLRQKRKLRIGFERLITFRLWKRNNKLIFRITGNGFLYNMVRIIVGTVLEVGEGKRKTRRFPEILEAKDRDSSRENRPVVTVYIYVKVYY